MENTKHGDAGAFILRSFCFCLFVFVFCAFVLYRLTFRLLRRPERDFTRTHTHTVGTQVHLTHCRCEIKTEETLRDKEKKHTNDSR